MASRELSDLEISIARRAGRLISACEQLGIGVFVTSTLRSFAEQDALYALGRSRPGKVVTNAPAGYSAHNPLAGGAAKALAFDIAFRPEDDPHGATWDGPWELVGAMGEQLGLEWGGRWDSFPDRPHFQDLMGVTLAGWRDLAGLA